MREAGATGRRARSAASSRHEACVRAGAKSGAHHHEDPLESEQASDRGGGGSAPSGIQRRGGTDVHCEHREDEEHQAGDEEGEGEAAPLIEDASDCWPDHHRRETRADDQPKRVAAERGSTGRARGERQGWSGTVGAEVHAERRRQSAERRAAVAPAYDSAWPGTMRRVIAWVAGSFRPDMNPSSKRFVAAHAVKPPAPWMPPASPKPAMNTACAEEAREVNVCVRGGVRRRGAQQRAPTSSGGAGSSSGAQRRQRRRRAPAASTSSAAARMDRWCA